MGDRTVSLYRSVASLPLPVTIRMRSIQGIRYFVDIIHRRNVRDGRVPMLLSNGGYGHEYWLRKYSGWKHTIYAQIEHGVYFGKNTSAQVNLIEQEAEIGSVITYGPYRRKCILESYPDYSVAEVGPYIQYAITDKEYAARLERKLAPGSKVLVLMPAHSVRDGSPLFDVDELILSVKELAYQKECQNVVACLSAFDYRSVTARRYKDAGFTIVTAGTDPIAFLPRLRAIMECADVTVSNDIGTHIGYSLSVGTPHIVTNELSVDSRIAGNIVAPGTNIQALKEERSEIAFAFSSKNSDSIRTPLQQSIYDRYWGGNISLTPEQMHLLLCKLRRDYYRRITRGITP